MLSGKWPKVTELASFRATLGHRLLDPALLHCFPYFPLSLAISRLKQNTRFQK